MSEGAGPSAGAPRTARAQSASEKGAICVLLARGEPPADLLESLSLRAVTVVRCPDAFGAMAEIMRLVHAPEPLILLIVEPGTVPRAAELARSVERYAPQAVCWRFDSAARPALRGYIAPAERPAARVQPANGAPASSSRAEPRLRLTGIDESSPPVAGANAPAPARVPQESPEPERGAQPATPDRPADLLTEAELAMLLSHDFPDDLPSDKGQGR